MLLNPEKVKHKLLKKKQKKACRVTSRSSIRKFQFHKKEEK